MERHPYAHLGLLSMALMLIAGLEFLALISGIPEQGNQVGPVLLGLVCAWALVKLLRESPMLFLSAFPWALIAAIAYSCAGPLVLVYGTHETIHSYHSRLAVNSSELLQTNVLNAVFLAIATCVYYLFRKGQRVSVNTVEIVHKLDDKTAAKALVLVCLAIGLPVQVFLVYPYEFGQLSFIPPNSILRLGKLTTLALIPLWFLAGSRQHVYTPIAIALFAAELAMGLLTFGKSAVLMCIVFSGIGYYLAKRTQRSLNVLAVLLVIVYVSLAPIVKVCREEAGLMVRPGKVLNYQQRAMLLSNVIWNVNDVRTNRTSDRIQYGWRRLNYANAQWFVMEFYNNGQSFDSYRNAFWALVPRLLVPDKPNMTDLGIDLNFLINRHRGSSMAVGIAAEAYGVGGKLYVVLAGLFIGYVFVFVDSRYAFNQKGGWLYLPVQIICMRMGYRLDGAMVPDYLGSLVIVIVYSYIAKVLIDQWLKPRSSHNVI
jgi:hypothetical protein